MHVVLYVFSLKTFRAFVLHSTCSRTCWSVTSQSKHYLYTHSHDALHCLQLQGVFVAVQHLLQVVMSEGGKHWKLAHSFSGFFLLIFFSSKRLRLPRPQTRSVDLFYNFHSTLKIDQSLQVWPRNYSLWSRKSSLQNMETFETAAHKSGVIGKWHNP